MVLIDSFLGERNTADEKSLPIGALAASQNIDLDDYGIIESRDGFTLAQGFASVTASFGTADERRLFIIDGGELKLVHDDFTTLTLRAGMPTSYIKWLEVADHVFLNSGHVIMPDLSVVDWRMSVPNQPAVSVISGDLPAGQYQIVSIFRDQRGRESAASEAFVVDVEEGSGLAVTPDYQSGYSSVLYVTDTNGAEFYLAAERSSGSITVVDTSLLVYPLDKHQLNAGGLPEEIGSMAFFEGSVWVSQYIDGVSYLWRSKPYWWHLFDLHEDYITIPGKVVALEGTPQGLLIGTDDEIYLYTVDGALVRLAEYGMIQGRPIAVTDDGRYFVWTKRGVCSLFPFQNITEDKVSLPPGCICSTAIIDRNGYSQFMVLNDGSGVAFNKL